jgi:hypothetical protein
MNRRILLTLFIVYVFIVGAVLIGGLLMTRATGEEVFSIAPLLIALVLLAIFFAIGIGVAVYHDAKQRGMEPLVWALVAALVPYFIGLIAYLVVRQPKAAVCGSCGAAVTAGDSFCKSCGSRISAPCPACARPIDASARFCQHCGANLDSPSAPPVKVD